MLIIFTGLGDEKRMVYSTKIVSSGATVLRVCGGCIHADQRLEPRKIQNMKMGGYLVMLRRYSKTLRDTKVFCRREKIDVSLLDEVCAFFRPYY